MTRLALVTGGAGFIGSHLVEELLRRGFAVRVLDDFSSGRDANLTAVRDRIDVVRGDCADPEAAARAAAGAGVVFHLAAIPSVQRSVEEPLASHRVNATGTLAVLDAARRAGVRRFVFAGSSSAYGDDPTLPKRESMRPEPLSPYAASKLAGEHYCRAYAACFGLHTVVLRFFNVYGPRQDPSSPYSGVISLFVTALLEGRAPTVFGDGGQSRDFVYVADVVRALAAAADADVPAGEAFNVAGGRGVTIDELFRSIRAAAGGRAAGLEPRHADARAGDIRHSLADLARARERLGFAPSVALDEGIRRTVDHYRQETKS